MTSADAICVSKYAMRRCPNCNRVYPTSDKYYFCVEDGTNLLSESEAVEAVTLQGVSSEAPTLNIPSGAVRSENVTAFEMAERLNRIGELETLRDDLHRKEEAIKYAHDEVDSLLASVHKQVSEINESFPNVDIEFLVIENRQVAIVANSYGLKISWQQPYRNNLMESRLIIVEYRRGSNTLGLEERVLSKIMCELDVIQGFELGWKDRKRFISTQNLARECVTRFMSLLQDRPA